MLLQRKEYGNNIFLSAVKTWTCEKKNDNRQVITCLYVLTVIGVISLSQNYGCEFFL